MRAPHSWPNHFPKAPPSKIIILGHRITICGFWGDTNMQTIADHHMEKHGHHKSANLLKSLSSTLSFIHYGCLYQSKSLFSSSKNWVGGQLSFPVNSVFGKTTVLHIKMQVVFSTAINVSLVSRQETSPLLCLCGEWREADIDPLLDSLGSRNSYPGVFNSLDSNELCSNICIFWFVFLMFKIHFI